MLVYGKRFIWAGQPYRCRYVCTACQRRSSERGSFFSPDRVALNNMAPSWQEKVELSGELAQARARRRFYRLQARVNNRQWTWGLRVSGVCRHCGHRQCWSPRLRHSAALLAAIACFVVLWAVNGMPADGNQWLIRIAAAIGTGALAQWLALLLMQQRLRRLDARFLPEIMEAKK